MKEQHRTETSALFPLQPARLSLALRPDYKDKRQFPSTDMNTIPGKGKGPFSAPEKYLVILTELGRVGSWL